LARWAVKASLDVELAGCDASDEAVSHARAAAAQAGVPISFFTLKVARDPLPEGYDMIMSTLFLHHLDEGDAIAFLREGAARTRDRLLIQDILRSRLSYWFARAGARLLLLHDICPLDSSHSPACPPPKRHLPARWRLLVRGGVETGRSEGACQDGRSCRRRDRAALSLSL